MNKTTSQFYWQVQKAERTKSKFLIKQAELNKDLFLISKDLTIEDWRRIRAGDYYSKRDELTGNEQMEFILNRIKIYR